MPKFPLHLPDVEDFPKLIFAVSICQAAAFIGSIFTYPSITGWYASLEKPIFNPPNWVFAPVWIFLYFLMGISLFLVWQTVDPMLSSNRQRGLIFFFIQLSLNTLWSAVFFGSQNILGGLLVILPLWFLILATIISFHKINKLAAYLLYPYLAWVSFAIILNFAVWQLNKI